MRPGVWGLLQDVPGGALRYHNARPIHPARNARSLAILRSSAMFARRRGESEKRREKRSGGRA